MKKSTRLSTRNESFVDTSGFYALLVRGDRQHGRAKKILAAAARSGGRFVTTDYILDETATLLRARELGHLAEAFFESVFASVACRVEWMDPDRFAQTRQFFLKHHDKQWSFTDRFSFGIMGALGLRDALTTDSHFRQAGYYPLLAGE
jgi:predicted nucleic acid-binding protein